MKRGQFSFVWLFAILAGGAILALAVWGALSAGNTLRYSVDSEAAQSISVLTDSLQSSFAEGSFGMISFQSETRISNVCVDSGVGYNGISVATRSSVGDEWNDGGTRVSVYDKYIFSNERIEGEDFYVFSKGFDFPYEVSDLIFLYSESYCFLDAPEIVEDDVLGLGLYNVELVEANCSASDVRVCFGGGSDCDVVVYGGCEVGCDSAYDYGRVVKEDESLMYFGDLIYGAIFGNENSYDCNVNRLLYRARLIGEIFSDKVDLMISRGCDTNVKSSLSVWVGLLDGATSEDLISLGEFAEELDAVKGGVCPVW